MRQKKETVLEKKASTLPEISLYSHTSALTSNHFTADTCLVSFLCLIILYLSDFNTLNVWCPVNVFLSFVVVADSIKMPWRKNISHKGLSHADVKKKLRVEIQVSYLCIYNSL